LSFESCSRRQLRLSKPFLCLYLDPRYSAGIDVARERLGAPTSGCQGTLSELPEGEDKPEGQQMQASTTQSLRQLPIGMRVSRPRGNKSLRVRPQHGQ